MLIWPIAEKVFFSVMEIVAHWQQHYVAVVDFGFRSMGQ